MTVKEFNDEYKGGIVLLTEMRALLYPQDQIAAAFGVTKEGVRKWMKEFFGENYDPRGPRRNAIIESMLQFARFNTIEDFMEAYRGTEYYKEAMAVARERDYYPKELK